MLKHRRLFLKLVIGILLTALLPTIAFADEISYELDVRVAGQYQADIGPLFVDGNYAYIGEASQLSILDISDPTVPRLLGSSEPLKEEPQSIYVSGGYGYVACGYGGLLIYDVSDTMQPSRVGTWQYDRSCNSVFVRGTDAFVACSDCLYTLDVSDPTQPVRRGAACPAGTGEAVYVEGDYAYLADGEGGIQIIDVSDLDWPKQVSSCDTDLDNAHDVWYSDGYIYAADAYYGLSFAEVTKPYQPVAKPSYDGIPETAQAVCVVGDYAYVGAGSAGLWVIDVSDPTQLALVGSYDALGAVVDVYADDDYVYLANAEGGLQILQCEITEVETQDEEHSGFWWWKWVAVYFGLLAIAAIVLLLKPKK